VNILLDPSILIKKAASRVRGDRLSRLREVCENQKTISTRRLSRLLEDLEQSDIQDGHHFRVIADHLRKDGK
jgi:hypothetical protein